MLYNTYVIIYNILLERENIGSVNFNVLAVSREAAK